jgi:hypothetical protein
MYTHLPLKAAPFPFIKQGTRDGGENIKSSCLK